MIAVLSGSRVCGRTARSADIGTLLHTETFRKQTLMNSGKADNAPRMLIEEPRIFYIRTFGDWIKLLKPEWLRRPKATTLFFPIAEDLESATLKSYSAYLVFTRTVASFRCGSCCLLNTEKRTDFDHILRRQQIKVFRLVGKLTLVNSRHLLAKGCRPLPTSHHFFLKLLISTSYTANPHLSL